MKIFLVLEKIIELIFILSLDIAVPLTLHFAVLLDVCKI